MLGNWEIYENASGLGKEMLSGVYFNLVMAGGNTGKQKT
jgi:hypothetical protein